MFSGCFTTFAGEWVLVPVKNKSITTEVENELERQATEAINAGTPLIWLYWPYSESGQANVIFNVLKDVENRLKKNVKIKRRTRFSVAPTHVAHDPKAQFAILYIRVSR